MATPKVVAQGTAGPAGTVNAWIAATKTPLSSLTRSDASEGKVSWWHDPDPVMGVVDVQSDAEFLETRWVAI